MPVSAYETKELFQVAFLKGVPPEVNTMRMRQVEDFWGACGSGNPDDVEMFERNMAGLEGEVDPWVLLKRGDYRERVDVDGTIIGDMTDEVTQPSTSRGALSDPRQSLRMKMPPVIRVSSRTSRIGSDPGPEPGSTHRSPSPV